MITPNVKCEVIQQAERDVYGEVSWGTPLEERCAIIRLTDGDVKSTVRVDSSASRGFAREGSSEARLLFPVNTVVVSGDRINVQGIELKAVKVHPRLDVLGNLNHYEVDCDRWA